MIKKKLMAAAIAAAAGIISTGAFAANDAVPGMLMHVNGHQLILSGDVGWLDGYALQNLLQRLSDRGISIDTLVMRDSRGGALNAGYDIGYLARGLGLKTIVSGYCISACSTMFVGGTERAFADDQPLWRQYIGIHGAHTSNGLADAATQQGIYHYFLDMIAGGDPSKTDDALLQNAFLHMLDGQALARVYDPAAGRDPAVYWCNSGNQAYADCLKYPTDSAYSLGLVTQTGHAATTDTLHIDGAVSGNINPNFYNPWDPAVGTYASTAPVPGMPGYVNLFFNDAAFTLADSYGVLRLADGGHWTLGRDAQNAPIRTAADSLWINNGGTLTLDGGILNIKDNYVDAGGVVEGNGQFGQIDEWTYLFVDPGARVHPTGAGIDLTGEVVLYDNATLALDVTPGQTDQPSLRIGLNVPNGDTPEMGALVAYPNANLALHVAPGFYRPGDDYALIGLTAETAQIRAAVGDQVPSNFFDFLYGGFQHVVRADATGQLLGDGYAVDPLGSDPTASAFHPFADSLVSYQVLEQGDGVWLQVNDPFLSTSFCYHGDCSLGRSLSAAAQSSSNTMQPLLAALEFGTATQARTAANQLRGTGYANWRTAQLGLVDAFGQALGQHLLAADPVAEQAGVAAASLSAGAGMPGRSVNLPNVMRYLVANDDGTSNLTASSDRMLWGRVFGHRGRLAGNADASALRNDSSGFLLGLDRRYESGLVIGGSLGFGQQSVSAVDGGFSGTSHALDARVYLARHSDGGYVDASFGYTHLRNSAQRTLTLPLYVGMARSRFSGNVLSLQFEHGWTLHDRHGTVWQPILPQIELTHLPTLGVNESGDPALQLQVQGKKVLTSRVGAGVQAYRTFMTGKGTTITPHARLLLQHRFQTHEQQLTANFAGGTGGGFDVSGPGEGHNHALVNLGVTARRTDRLTLMADYVGDFSRGHRDQGLLLGLRYRW